VNSEELEQSLRTEFEAYLKRIVSKMRDDAVEFQKKIESEFDAQRAQLEQQRAKIDESFREFNSRYEAAHSFDKAFSETVVEHLRLARDEGSQIAANALAEAEQLRYEAPPAPPAADFGKLNEAIKEISAQQSQATILKSLVSHAAEYAARGAFFIVKSDHFVGWKTLGNDSDDDAVQDVEFPISSSSLLGRAVNTLSTTEGSYDPDSDDRAFLEQLRFGQPQRMFAIPLTARGRGVAVLYVDLGAEGRQPDLSALEALVRVAGMTVELQAAARSMVAPQPAPQPAPAVEEVPAKPETVSEEAASTDFSFAESSPEAAPAEETSFEAVPDTFVPRGFDTDAKADEPTAEEISAWEAPTADEASPAAEEAPAPSVDTPSVPAADFEPTPFGSPSVATTVADVTTTVPAAPVAVQTPRSRLSNRNVDLPIEVAEDERRLHNDARRFARLLVSEIKLYNEQKVKEGRAAGDLYERLREAIDRSREMYEKRVQPPVAAKFDYFNYELVNSLAEGEATRLGANYPGPTV
jgi:uncharacterized membrane-anchored protein YhcB (DUF1043 family)